MFNTKKQQELQKKLEENLGKAKDQLQESISKWDSAISELQETIKLAQEFLDVTAATAGTDERYDNLNAIHDRAIEEAAAKVDPTTANCFNCFGANLRAVPVEKKLVTICNDCNLEQ